MLAKYAKTRLVCMRVHMQLNIHIQVVIITFNEVVSSCFFPVVVLCIELFLFLFFVFFFVLARPNKFLIIGVVITDPAVDANYTFLSYLPRQSMYVNCRYPLCNFIVYWIQEQLFMVAATIYYNYSLLSCRFLVLQLRLNESLNFPLMRQKFTCWTHLNKTRQSLA